MKAKRLYFAYGSNMCPSQMRLRCPDAKPVGPASLSGFAFLINERGVATLRRDARAKVHGVLWRISPDCEALLDIYEGVDSGFYKKTRLFTSNGKGERVQALVYIDQRTEPGIPRPGYIRRILRGALIFELPASYLKKIRHFEKGAFSHAV